jgi:hypothetical protein
MYKNVLEYLVEMRGYAIEKEEKLFASLLDDAY